MRVTLSTPGIFHIFALARELESRGHLERVYSTYPWRRVRREGLARAQVRTFPYVHPPLLALPKRFKRSRAWSDVFDSLTASTFDRYVAATLSPCDYLIASSGSGLRSGLRAKALGATYICDRGSSHMRYHVNLLAEEYARWGCAIEPPRLSVMKREEAEYEAADLIFVPSEFSRRSFVEMGVPPEKLRKVVLATDVKRFYPVAQSAGGEFCVLYVGQISFRKGIPYLLEAFSRLRHPNKRLRLIGHVDARIRTYLETAKLDRAEFVGGKPFEQVLEAMSQAHVTVLPSVDDGFGMGAGRGHGLRLAGHQHGQH